MSSPIRVAVTGAGGQIGYALLFRIASGAIFGPDQPVSLQLLEITPALPALNGTIMELEDCAFPTLADVTASDKAEEAFGGADWVILVGGLPRKDGHVARRPDPCQQPDLHGPGQGDQRGRRSQRADLDRRQPVQHELPDRPVARSQGSGRPLVRDDPARPEPGRLPAGQESRRTGRRGHAT